MEGLYFKAKKLKKDVAITDIQPGFVDTGMGKGDGKFWVATTEKAAEPMYTAITRRKKKAFVTKRWWLIAAILKWMPNFIYKKIG